MANNKFRNKLFGGFNRDDVVAYIEGNAQTINDYKSRIDTLEQLHEDQSKELENSLDLRNSLTEERDKLAQKNSALTAELEALKKQHASVLTELAAKNDETNSLSQRLSDLQASAEMFEVTKERLVLLELNASKRAVDIEKAAEEKADELLHKCSDVIRELKKEYETVLRETEATSLHIRGELDKLGTRLTELTEQLTQKADTLSILDGLARGIQ